MEDGRWSYLKQHRKQLFVKIHEEIASPLEQNRPTVRDFFRHLSDESVEVVTTREEQMDIVRRYHEGHTDLTENNTATIKTHLTRRKTIIEIKKHFFWPRISQDVYRLVHSCTVCCQKPKKTLKRPRTDSNDDDCIFIKSIDAPHIPAKIPKKCHIAHF